MKISLTDEKRVQLTLNKHEYVLVCTRYNETIPPEYRYDLDEIINDEREEITITEDDLDENENGFVMWSDTFWSIVKTDSEVSMNLRTRGLNGISDDE
jgi:hypothetical protein